ncbi:hypothetical protein [Paracoccus sp. J56]|uniref:hypothetical protein n=1 Tax=Paracoccus sp. J56 TaxID=935850 RepID=UPI00111C2130|nr:hypothetical protein [Paracoccus sp. J56]
MAAAPVLGLSRAFPPLTQHGQVSPDLIWINLHPLLGKNRPDLDFMFPAKETAQIAVSDLLVN